MPCTQTANRNHLIPLPSCGGKSSPMGTRTRHVRAFPKEFHVLILDYPKGISPRFRPPAQEEVPTPDETTPVVEEPHTFLPQDTRIVDATPPAADPESFVYSRPRMQTASNPTTPVTPPARGGFAAQFYPQFMSRSHSDIPTVPAAQPASRQDDAPFSFVRQAFTQAIAPVAMSVVPNNVPGVRHQCTS